MSIASWCWLAYRKPRHFNAVRWQALDCVGSEPAAQQGSPHDPCLVAAATGLRSNKNKTTGARRGGPFRARRRAGRSRRIRRPPACCSGPIRPVRTQRPGRPARPARHLRVRRARVPLSTTLISRNSGRWPGSSQPLGDVMRATLTFWSLEFTRPTNSSICLGLLPAAVIRVGWAMSLGMGRSSARQANARSGQRQYLDPHRLTPSQRRGDSPVRSPSAPG